jgi:hypothetical protein
MFLKLMADLGHLGRFRAPFNRCVERAMQGTLGPENRLHALTHFCIMISFLVFPYSAAAATVS